MYVPEPEQNMELARLRMQDVSADHYRIKNCCLKLPKKKSPPTGYMISFSPDGWKWNIEYE
jgi:hypothetical protein